MNESTDDQILQANSPVVPAGVMLVRCLTTSTWFESLVVVSGVGCSKSIWFKCRVSFGSHDGGISDSTSLPGRVSASSSLSKGIEREGLYHSFKRLSLPFY